MSYEISLIILKQWLKEKYDEILKEEFLNLDEYIALTSQELLDLTSLYMKHEMYKLIDRCESREKLTSVDLKREVRALYDSLNANREDIENKFK